MARKSLEELSKDFYWEIISRIRRNQLKASLVARCTFYQIRRILPKEEGKYLIINNDIEKGRKIILNRDRVLFTPLNREGRPVLDQEGKYMFYDCDMKLLAQHYTRVGDGIYAKDIAPVYCVEVPEDLIPKKGRLLPPRANGRECQIEKGGCVLLPYFKGKTLYEHIARWSQVNEKGNFVTIWGITNLPELYDECDEEGNFKDDKYRAIYEQMGIVKA